MRIVAALLIASGLLPATAHASSILVLTPTSDEPSIVTLGASSVSPSSVAAGTADPAASPSILALGEAQPGIAYESVAAIGGDVEKSQARRNDPPMVIRGGIVGDAFTRGTRISASPMSSAERPQSAETPSQHPDEPIVKLE
jgi:hypothetical protein